MGWIGLGSHITPHHYWWRAVTAHFMQMVGWCGIGWDAMGWVGLGSHTTPLLAEGGHLVLHTDGRLVWDGMGWFGMASHTTPLLGETDGRSV